MSKNLDKHLTTIISNQINNNNPKCTKEAYLKLQNIGYSKKQAKEILSAILLDELEFMYASNTEFNEASYEKRINEGLKETLELTEKIKEFQEHPENIELYEMKITARGYSTKLHRTILIPAIATVADLAYTIMSVMKATDGHLYHIVYNHEIYDCNINTNDDIYEDEKIDATTTLLYSLELDEKSKLKMTYDFGDDWVFEIKVNKVTKIDPNEKYPKVIKGKGYGIFENNRLIFEQEMEHGFSYLDVSDEADKPSYPYADFKDFDVEDYQKNLETEFPNIKEIYEGPLDN